MEPIHYLDKWNAELAGKYNARELQNMWRILCREGPDLNMDAIIDRLSHGEPFDYVLGHSEFYSLPFKVDGAVLIPRPETEELVDWVLSDRSGEKSYEVLDIGTGSGCIAIALARHRPSWRITGIDISTEALEVASENAKLNDVKVELLPCDILKELPGGKFDLLISNPPYIPESESGLMTTSTLNYEPHQALFTGGDDALLFYRRIGQAADGLLLPGGSLYFELNEFLSGAISECLIEMGYAVEVRKDIQGKDRMLKAVKVNV